MHTTPPTPLDHALSHLGRRMAAARIFQCMTQDDLAQACGVSRRAIQHLEAGRNVALSTWLAVADRLGYLQDIVGAMAHDRPTTIKQAHAIAEGRYAQPKRVRR